MPFDPNIFWQFVMGGTALLIIAEKLVKIFRKSPPLERRLTEASQILLTHSKELDRLEKEIEKLTSQTAERFGQVEDDRKQYTGAIHRRLDSVSQDLSEITGKLGLLIPQLNQIHDRLNRHVEQSPKSRN